MRAIVWGVWSADLFVCVCVCMHVCIQEMQLGVPAVDVRLSTARAPLVSVAT